MIVSKELFKHHPGAIIYPTFAGTWKSVQILKIFGERHCKILYEVTASNMNFH